jgi:DNA-binding LacI/PurR family transcriptional regulator
MSKRKSDPTTATVTTVAAKAKVAPMTVSRVINGGYVSAEVRARVERVIKEVGYAPSSTARSLRYGRKGCIGVAVESIHDAWFMGLLGGIEGELAKSHVGLMLGSWKPGDGPYDSSIIAAWVDARRVDGLIIVRSTKRELPLLKSAAAAAMPVTLICPDQAAEVGFTVRCRNFDAGKALGAHLLAQGHRRLSFAGGPRESIDSADRLRGLQEVVASVKGATLRPEDVSFQGSYMPRAGTAAALEYLKRPAAKRATAVVLGNDSMAIAFICEMLRAGMRVPADVSVAGFDGIDEGERCWPSLTTVAQPMNRLGAAACRGLLDRIEDPALDPRISAEFPMLLVERESTAPPSSGAPRAAPKGGKKPRDASLS